MAEEAERPAWAEPEVFSAKPESTPYGALSHKGHRSEFETFAPSLKVFYARDIVGRTGWELHVLDLLTENVFVTIDVDGLDPSVIPATGTPEPGGLGWYETLRLLRMVCHHKNVVGFDVMELCPMPPYHASEFACARLIYKMLGYLFEPSKEP